MNDAPPTTPARSKARRCGWLILGSVIFGLLMGSRAEFQSVWVRSLTAGAAAAALGICIFQARK